MATTAQQYWNALGWGLFGDGVAPFSWEQLGKAGQDIISKYYRDNVLPSIVGQDMYDIMGNQVVANETYSNPAAYTADQFSSINYSPESGGIFSNQPGYSPENATPSIFAQQSPYVKFKDDFRAAQSSGLYNNLKLDGYTGQTNLPQASALYAINPQLAESLGITKQKALDWANQQDAIQRVLAREEASEANRDGWLMALSTIGAGVGGAYAGLGNAAEGAGMFSASDVAAGAGAGAGAGSAAGGALVGPATGADASIGANGAVVSAAPGTSTAGITTTDLAAFGGASAGSAAGSSTGTSGSAGGLSSGTSGSTGSSSGLLNGDTVKLGSALVGGLLGGTNGAKQAGTTTTTNAPWTSQQPYLLDVFKQAKAASQGSPLTQQANTNYQSVLSGPTVNPMLGLNNPYLQQSIDYANQDVNRAFMPAMNQANRASGSYGNSGVADTFSKNMLDAYGRNATTMRMQDYTNQQNLQQQNVNNVLDFTKYANTYNAEPSKLYGQTVQGNYGGTTSTPYYENKYANILGGVSTALGLYNAYNGSK